MVTFLRKLLLVVAAASLPSIAAGGSLSWFDEAGPGAARLRSASLLTDDTEVRFDLDLASLADSEEVLAETAAVTRPADTTLRVYGGVGESLSVASGNDAGDDAAFVRRGGFGVGLEHRLDGHDSLGFAAEYGENLRDNVFAEDTADARAVASYRRAFGHALQPSVTGSFFLGDESARDESYDQLGRQYLGLELSGQMTLFKSHTPYVAFQMRRSYYGAPLTPEDALPTEGPLSPRTDDRSSLTAGWHWQAGRDVSLQAEASYGLNHGGLDLYNPERSRMFFGTRFDFR